MTSVTFVHGTGVRKPAYDSSFAEVEAACARWGATARRCYWGHLGSALQAGGRSVPTYDQTRGFELAAGPEVSAEEAYVVALWSALFDDPLYELRLLALRPGPAGERGFGVEAPGVALGERAAALALSGPLQALLERAGLAAVFADARAAVLASQPCRAALDAAGATLDDERAALARAFVAEAAARLASDDTLPAVETDRALRDALEAALFQALGGGERGFGGWVQSKLAGLVVRAAAGHATRRRGAVTDATSAAAGDILLYQARPEAIHDFIAGCIADAPPPRVVIAHSLGGIACVDLLVQRPLGVELLVTVGSQAPYLYEIGALRSLRHPQPLPDRFPRWLNVYDLRDLLSYVGAGVFGGRVRDVKVDNGVAFPAAHSAYWTNDALWQALGPELP